MLLIPALDLRGGACVRLIQGNYDQEIPYQSDPVQVARDWKEAGARFLHIVDLDGARQGEPVHEALMAQIAQVGLPFQVGGGLRTQEHAARLLELGAERVILGTTSSAGELFAEVAQAFPGRVWASIDVDAQDRLRIKGWLEQTDQTGYQTAQRCLQQGAAGLIFTATGQDGTLGGPLLPPYLEQLDGPMIYAGGIGNYDHLRQLVHQGGQYLTGVIAGRALYDGHLVLDEAQKVIEEELAHVDS